ncbi:MAG: hypothetical protein IKR19_08680 [Acholeplasmatales bacterium]|nr:hypothetical protein [Acholeplasmatales bacterium]
MNTLSFPIYSYISFNRKHGDLDYKEPESRGDIIRYDYFNLTKLDIDTKRKLFENMQKEFDEAKAQGFEYKDYIINRYFFKQFVIREKTDAENQTRFYKYSLSDWDERNKSIGLDDRILTVDIYTEFEDGFFQRDMSLKLRVGHRHEILDYINTVLDKCEYNTENIRRQDLYIAPLYYTVDTTDEGSYYRISDMNNKGGSWSDNLIIKNLQYIPQSLMRFSLFNFYMLNKVEDNSTMEFIDSNTGNTTSDNIVEYIKKNPTKDKKVMIYDNTGMRIKINPERKNIYSHDNLSIRTLCDYKFQVRAHYQHYWVGSSCDGTLHREYRWKESYYKNPDNKFRIIKERNTITKEEDNIRNDQSN